MILCLCSPSVSRLRKTGSRIHRPKESGTTPMIEIKRIQQQPDACHLRCHGSCLPTSLTLNNPRLSQDRDGMLWLWCCGDWFLAVQENILRQKSQNRWQLRLSGCNPPVFVFNCRQTARFFFGRKSNQRAQVFYKKERYSHHERRPVTTLTMTPSEEIDEG